MRRVFLSGLTLEQLHELRWTLYWECGAMVNKRWFDFVEMTWTFEDGTKAHFGKNFNREWLKSLRYEKQILLLQEKIRLLES